MEEGKKLLDGALERLRSALEQGQSEQLKAYLRVMRRFRKYSVRNLLLIGMQRSDATHVAGFHTWKRQFRRRVKKGERGIRILAPVLLRSNTDGEDEEKAECVTGFRTVSVFDVNQTEGDPLPQPAKAQGDPASALPKLYAFAAAHGILVEYGGDKLGSALGASLGGTIILRPGMSAADEFSTLAHELAHELLHRDDKMTDRRVRELEGEAIAFVVCDAFRVDSTVASSDYLKLYGANSDDLLASLERIKQIALAIIHAIEYDQNRPASDLTGRSLISAAMQSEACSDPVVS